MEINKKIEDLINNNDVCLFMKGTPESPQCGFSMAVSNVLKHLNVNFKGINVLEDEKRLGTCYFSIGDNTTLGGSSAVGIHIPGVLTNPSVWLDDSQILQDGEFILDI